MQRFAQEYLDAGKPWPATTRELAVWAIEEKGWEPPFSALVSMCAEDFADAMRQEVYRDPQGREVRTKYATRVKEGAVQKTLWDDVRNPNSDPRMFLVSCQQQRKSLVSEVWHLKRKSESYNENHRPPRNLMFNLDPDFTEDMKELEALAAEEAAEQAELETAA